jgi:SSS family solute:Na+ symporter
VLSFGYWTTNVAESSGRSAAKDLSAGHARRSSAPTRRSSPGMTIIPGLSPCPGAQPRQGGASITDTAARSRPTTTRSRADGHTAAQRVLGIALTGLLAAFMLHGRERELLQHGLHVRIWRRTSAEPARLVLPAGGALRHGGRVLIGILTAFIASGYSNIMNYIQLLFSIFNAPLFATFLIDVLEARHLVGASGVGRRHLGAVIGHFAFTGLDIGGWHVWDPW